MALRAGDDAPNHPGWEHLPRKVRQARGRRLDERRERGQTRRVEAAAIAAGAAGAASGDDEVFGLARHSG
jgi:hypothetical protein